MPTTARSLLATEFGLHDADDDAFGLACTFQVASHLKRTTQLGIAADNADATVLSCTDTFSRDRCCQWRLAGVSLTTLDQERRPGEVHRQVAE